MIMATVLLKIKHEMKLHTDGVKSNVAHREIKTLTYKIKYINEN